MTEMTVFVDGKHFLTAELTDVKATFSGGEFTVTGQYPTLDLDEVVARLERGEQLPPRLRTSEGTTCPTSP